MSDQISATPEAPDTPSEPENPFVGFETEAFEAGEPVETAETPQQAESAEEELETPEEPETPEREEAAEKPAAPAAPKKQTAQERIDELTRARREAEREAADLRKRLEALEQRVPKEETAKKESGAPEKEAAKGPPKPDDFEFGELDSEYIAAVVDYRTEQRFAELREREAQERQQAAVQTKFEQQIEQGRQKYADFDEKVVQGAQEGAWPLSETLGVLLVQSEVGEDIAYHLAINPDEAARVDRLAPMEQARYFGRLEARFSAARAAATGGEEPAVTPATTRAPKAPPPVVPGKGAGGRFQATARSDDFAAFERAANQSN